MVCLGKPARAKGQVLEEHKMRRWELPHKERVGKPMALIWELVCQ